MFDASEIARVTDRDEGFSACGVAWATSANTLEFVMTKSTVTHLNLLASAGGRDDGLVPRPSHLKPAAAAKVAVKLIEQGLAREVLAKGEMPIWGTDDQGRAFSLKISKAGRLAVQSAQQAESRTPLEGSKPVVAAADVLQERVRVGAEPTRTGSKRAIVLSLMEREEGATIEDLMAATGWLAHTTRAALSGLRKKGLAIVRSRELEGQPSVYRIERQILAAAA